MVDTRIHGHDNHEAAEVAFLREVAGIQHEGSVKR
jgi:hypothetical protein